MYNDFNQSIDFYFKSAKSLPRVFWGACHNQRENPTDPSKAMQKLSSGKKRQADLYPGERLSALTHLGEKKVQKFEPIVIEIDIDIGE